jgi:hypothetical protein
MGARPPKLNFAGIFNIVLKYEKELILIEKSYYLLKPANQHFIFWPLLQGKVDLKTLKTKTSLFCP